MAYTGKRPGNVNTDFLEAGGELENHDEITVDASGNITATSFSGDGANLTGIEGVPSGIISMWSGLASAIPTGWNLCDGTNGTPNLVGKFIKAASTAGGTGGSNTHSHTHSLAAGSHTLSISQMPSHTHAYRKNYGGTYNGEYPHENSGHNRDATTGSTGGSSSHSHSLSGSITSGDNQPEYFELCYIMKT